MPNIGWFKSRKYAERFPANLALSKENIYTYKVIIEVE